MNSGPDPEHWLLTYPDPYVVGPRGSRSVIICMDPPVLWFRIHMDPHQMERQDPDPYQSDKLDPDPHQSVSCIRIQIILQITSQNVWNISLFEHLFKVFYLEARIRIRIEVSSRIQILPSTIQKIKKNHYFYSDLLILYRTSGVIFFIDYCTAIRDT